MPDAVPVVLPEPEVPQAARAAVQAIARTYFIICLVPFRSSGAGVVPAPLITLPGSSCGRKYQPPGMRVGPGAALLYAVSYAHASAQASPGRWCDIHLQSFRRRRVAHAVPRMDVRSFHPTAMASNQYRIAVLVGSIRKDSFNRQLALAVAKMAPQEFSFEHCAIHDLPLYNQDDDANQAEPVRRLKSEITRAQGVLFVTPEYNRSVPGVLKNAIDHASRPYGQSAFAGKAAGMIGISVGAIGTAMAQQHLRNMLAYLDMPTLGQPEAFVQNKEGLLLPDGGIGIESTRKFLQGWVDKYVAWVKIHAKM